MVDKKVMSREAFNGMIGNFDMDMECPFDYDKEGKLICHRGKRDNLNCEQHHRRYYKQYIKVEGE